MNLKEIESYSGFTTTIGLVVLNLGNWLGFLFAANDFFKSGKVAIGALCATIAIVPIICYVIIKFDDILTYLPTSSNDKSITLRRKISKNTNTTKSKKLSKNKLLKNYEK